MVLKISIHESHQRHFLEENERIIIINHLCEIVWAYWENRILLIVTIVLVLGGS
jgi:hypothetical protein